MSDFEMRRFASLFCNGGAWALDDEALEAIEETAARVRFERNPTEVKRNLQRMDLLRTLAYPDQAVPLRPQVVPVVRKVTFRLRYRGTAFLLGFTNGVEIRGLIDTIDVESV